MKRLNLKAAAGDLPLGWEAGERLAGTKREAPYRVGTKTPTGKGLNVQLAELGIGRKRIVVEGRYQPADSPLAAELPLFSRSTTIAGTLDAQSLGYLVHQMVRRFRDDEKARLHGQDTPPEVYVTGIFIRSEAAPVGERRVVTVEKVPKGKRKPVKVSTVQVRRVRYFDTVRGKFVSKDTWERSRRAHKARTPKGHKAPTGRYVRRVY